MTSEGLGEMFEGDSADTCSGKFLLVWKIPALDKLNYWERLKKLKMYSQQRRLERYRILYAWKILSNLAPNCGLVKVTSERRGRQLRIPLQKEDLGSNH